VVWASVCRHQVCVSTRASRRREELGLPRVSDREAKRRLRDNRARTARRHRAAARARGVAPAALGAPDIQGMTEDQGTVPMEQAERVVAQLGSSQVRPQVEPVLAVRGGGARRPYSPCHPCRNCACQQNRDYSAAQDTRSPTPHRSSHSRRRSSSSRRRSTSHRRFTRSPKRDASPGPPQLRREKAQPDETSPKDECTLSLADAQKQFSQGAMSQGSGSPISFLNPETCDTILQDLRGADGKLLDFDSVESDPGSPLPALKAEVARGERGTQSSPVPHQDQETQVVSRPHQATSTTQTPSSAPTSEQGTQVLLRPPRLVAFTQTATAPRSTRISWTQVPRPDL